MKSYGKRRRRICMLWGLSLTMMLCCYQPITALAAAVSPSGRSTTYAGENPTPPNPEPPQDPPQDPPLDPTPDPNPDPPKPPEPHLPGDILPDYPVETQAVNSVGKDSESDINLQGTMVGNLEVISVTLPASIPFFVGIRSNMTYDRILSAQATVESRSTCKVDVSITEVRDDNQKLGLFDLFLRSSQDAAGSDGTKLIPGAGQDLKLGSLKALVSDKSQPDSFTLHLDGKANSADAPIGTDQEKFNVGITVKVVNAGK